MGSVACTENTGHEVETQEEHAKLNTDSNQSSGTNQIKYKADQRKVSFSGITMEKELSTQRRQMDLEMKSGYGLFNLKKYH